MAALEEAYRIIHNELEEHRKNSKKIEAEFIARLKTLTGQKYGLKVGAKVRTQKGIRIELYDWDLPYSDQSLERPILKGLRIKKDGSLGQPVKIYRWDHWDVEKETADG